MTKRHRTLLFVSLLILFFVLAPAIVLYSQGFRLDLEQGRIAQTGAFYVKATPVRADVFVDGELARRTDFLFGSGLTKNFFPGEYFVEVVKEGYHPWQKILEVKEQYVTEAKNVLLIKEEPVFQKLADKVKRFWVAPDNTRALIQQTNPGQTWELFVLNLNTGGKESLLKQSKSKEQIIDIQWAPDSKHFLVQHTAQEQIVSRVHSISASPCFEKPCDLDYLGKNVQFSFAGPNHVLFTKFQSATQILLAANFQEKEAATPLASNVVAFGAQGTQITWLDAKGTLWQQNLGADSTPQIFLETGRMPKKETSHTLFVQSDSALLKEGNTLFLSSKDAPQAREVLSPVNEIVVSPQADKVALRNQSELWVLFLKEQTEQPPRQKEELILLTRFSQAPEQLFWVDSSHLLFSLEDSVRIAEIDNRDRLNIVPIAEFPNPKIFWNQKDSTLYVLSNAVFSVSEKLIR